jgi:DNA-binding YbaB/EbfC family protein
VSGEDEKHSDSGSELPDLGSLGGALPGLGGGALPDLSGLLSQLGQVQQNLQQAQEAAATQVVEGSAGGGMVRVRVTGGLEFQEITIDRSVVDPDDVDMLQDLVLAAVRDAVEKAQEMASDALGDIGLGGGLGGLLGGQ